MMDMVSCKMFGNDVINRLCQSSVNLSRSDVWACLDADPLRRVCANGAGKRRVLRFHGPKAATDDSQTD